MPPLYMFQLVHIVCWYMFPHGPNPPPPTQGLMGGPIGPPQGPGGPFGPPRAQGALRAPWGRTALRAVQELLCGFSCEMFSMSAVIQISPECPRKAPICQPPGRGIRRRGIHRGRANPPLFVGLRCVRPRVDGSLPTGAHKGLNFTAFIAIWSNIYEFGT